jgi:membrane protein implicated in regulation of membrane protease activity
MLIVFLPITVVCVLLMVAEVPQWLNILVLVVLLFVLFFLFTLICDKMDKKKNDRMSKKKDPFAD